jgi:hypothetical protein
MLDEQRQAPAATAHRLFSPPPILVTGSPRSGSTWVGNVLALDKGAGYVHEPFNWRCPPGLCRAGLTHFAYVTAENEAPYLEPLRDTLSWRYSAGAEIRTLRSPRGLARLARDFAYFETMRQRRARVILKDPLAIFSADWLASRFGARVVVIIRHPAAFVASMRAAGWEQQNFRVFQSQPRLIADRLAPFAAEIDAAVETPPDGLDAATLLWRLLHHHIGLLMTEHPDWIFVRHEDLSRDPETGFADLFARLGLDFSDEVRASLGQFTTDSGALGRLSLFGNKRRTMRNSHDSMHAFRRRLSPAEIARVRARAAPLWQRFYGEEDW